MIDSFVIFAKTGAVLYHVNGDDSTGESFSKPPLALVNQFIDTAFLGQHRISLQREKKCNLTPPSSSSTGGVGASSSMGDTVVAEWEESAPEDLREWVAVVFYKSVLQNRLNYIRLLLKMVLTEYTMFYDSVFNEIDRKRKEMNANDDNDNEQKGPGLGFIVEYPLRNHTPPPLDAQQKFSVTFLALQKKAEHQSKQLPRAVPTPPTSGNSLKHLPQRNSAHDLKNVGNHNNSKKTVWHDGKQKVTAEAMASLDYSKQVDDPEKEAEARLNREIAEARAAYLPSDSEVPMWEQEEEALQDEDVAFMNQPSDEGESSTSENPKGKGWGSYAWGLWEQMAGNKILTKDDLEPICQQMKDQLIAKNVSHGTATEICSLVQTQLVGKRLKSFGRIQTAVRTSLEKAIEQILTPNRSIDLLHDVVSKRDRQQGGVFGRRATASAKPYVIVFVGINGVGKSTSLAKIAYFLKSSGCNPMLAACDTFRSGAVEQLNVHAKCLEVPLFQRGYAKDPSSVAKAAVAHASDPGTSKDGEPKQERHDVVLVDTAGRMQNNVPLMKALTKLVVENQPDLVCFVGEALVGNDGMDQLQMFNQALRNGGHKRPIDGIILTKFDTVSDKVGAALTMTHMTGIPVLFVGTGQKYNHLKKLSVQSVIRSLFKK